MHKFLSFSIDLLQIREYSVDNKKRKGVKK